MTNTILTRSVSLIMAVVLIISAAIAVLRMDIYWTAVAIWAIALISTPNILRRVIPHNSVHWFIILTFSPYLVSFVTDPSGDGLLPLGSGTYWLFSGLSIFMLCLATVGYIARYSRMKLNLKFAMVIVYILFVSTYILQGPVYYYSDELLAMDILPGNDTLMTNIMLASFFGFFLTVLQFHVLKKSSLVEEHDIRKETRSA